MVALLEQEELVSVGRGIPMCRVYANPSALTFDIPPIRQLVKGYLHKSQVSVDPFARSKRWATYTNDLNPDTAAESHVDAEEFLIALKQRGVLADLLLFDPPYSPRQISECYKGIGREVTMQDTQNAVLYSRVKQHVSDLLVVGGIVVCCGWNSSGMQSHGNFEMVEMLMVNHGAARNDTIVTVERKVESGQGALAFNVPAN